jgi:hypothetical protein
LLVQKILTIGAPGKGICSVLFPYIVPMVPSASIVVAADGEHLMCGGFSLGKTIHLGNFEFITDYFGSLSLSPMKDDEGATFIGSTHGGATTPRRAMIEGSTEEFLVTSGGEGAWASLAPITTTPWLKDILDNTAAQQLERFL